MKYIKRLFICMVTVLTMFFCIGIPAKAEEQVTITLDPNGGALSNSTTIAATTGSTYGMISGERTFDQSSDGYTLGYANYDFGSTLTASIKLQFTNYDTNCFEFLDNFEYGGFGFGRGTNKSWYNSKEIFYFEVFVNNQYVMAYINNDLKPGETYWITGVYDGNNSRLELYVNGKKRTDIQIVVANTGSKVSTFSGAIGKSNMPVTLNANPVLGEKKFFALPANMTTYKAGVWTTAMSQEQITDMVSNDYINSNALINVDYTPRRPGCTFEGWYEDLNDPNSKITTNTKITKSTTLYAKWDTPSYTVHYDGNGATSGTTKDTQHKYDVASNLATNGFKKDGYLFEGWNTRADGFGKTYKNGQEVSDLSIVDGDTVTLYAMWSLDSDTFEFTVPTKVVATSDANGNISGDIQFTTTTKKRRWLDVSVTSDNNFALVDKSDSKNTLPYILSETSFKVEPQYTDSDSQSFSKDIKISAKDKNVAGEYSDKVTFNVSAYYETRTITLDCNGGTVNGQSEIQYTLKDGSSYGQLPVPKRDGFQFAAWKDEKGNAIYSGSVVFSESEKLTAEWKQSFIFAVSSTINGKNNTYFRNCGKAVIYINGEKITENANFLYIRDLTEGDTFKIDGIDASEGYSYIGFTSGQGADFSFEYYGDGRVKSVSGVFTDRNVILKFAFESDTLLQQLVRKYSLKSIIIDSDAPVSIEPLGSLDIFKSKADYYVNETELHIYNPNGGKVVAPDIADHLFSSLTIENIDASGLDVSNCSVIQGLFESDYQLKALNISNWNVSNCKNMSFIFNDCHSISNLNLEKWNVKNLVQASGMFNSMYNLESLDFIEKWDVSSLCDASNMFGNCLSVKKMNISNWNTSNLKQANGLFWDMRSIQSLNVTNLNLSNCRDIGYTFGGLNSLTEIIGLKSLDVSKVTSANSAFSGLYNIGKLELPIFNFDRLTFMNSMFSNDYGYISKSVRCSDSINE